VAPTTLRWPEGRGKFIDQDLDRAPLDLDPDAAPDRNPARGEDDLDTLGFDSSGRFAAKPGTVVDVTDPDTVDQYTARGWEVVETDAD
jgi:hypothetical protein